MYLRTLILCSSLWLAACATPRAADAPAPAGYYRVQSGDTLYRIARKHRQSVGNLARWNQLSDSSNIQAGQLLRVQPPSAGKTAGNASRPPAKPAEKPAPPPARLDIKLQWPASGALIAGFDGNRNKGIDIAGNAGDKVQAAAAGKVAYAGKGIRAYGNLLIIKHSDDTLTAYAHNQQLLVNEGDQVSAGQTIATMGDTGANRVKLHFELRLRGQAVDPAPYLPPR
ncbi:peptidoglycan DD-metalloendopeptidase family protein [Chromobacterium subtsugae]|uniref:Peptidoglycan DD-metalloendopeptidase family protein n=1 Tax=Chromobacterium subtsugae TaxID=251747 RepID=A0ABS7FAC0_9NEIS|nr:MULTISPECIES: peptidoglycan DD-metalloendopeptidase family protein [Chromobacterium]KUM04555.1 peptidase [Chromobacterium subtsugae]KZE87124.1 peptidase [Chromobacterium sp. F49]MBW7565932.1 peptidoglycan DD-metalloendopeptidase family protein [Chromobacterium subtsugae]MBW8287028.1 peptidoglycan DD-metalloendopeptidase family protein [Chromobacterium subtsugae]OBU88201.1 peptidase [Chromobacterium subtsugae]